LIVIIGLLVGTSGIAHAGGWAVVTLDPLAASPVEGQPLAVGFTILQHGVTPYTTSNAFITVTDASGRTEQFAAKPDGAPGHHIAQVTFAGSGVHRWVVQPDWFAAQPLGEINVASASAAAPTHEATANATTANATTTTTTTTTREPFALALRITLALALALALGAVIAELVMARRRATA
jgi:hypothetical protein